jgi:hypothetical protein
MLCCVVLCCVVLCCVVLCCVVLCYLRTTIFWNAIMNMLSFQALSPILEATNFPFVIELAALASWREYLNLEKWLQTCFDAHGEAFARACIQFLKQKLQRATTGDQSKRNTPQLSKKTHTIILSCLQANLQYVLVVLCCCCCCCCWKQY